MPTYRFYNKRTKKEYTDLMSISEMEKHKRQKHIELLPPTQMNIISSTGSLDAKRIASIILISLFKFIIVLI